MPPTLLRLVGILFVLFAFVTESTTAFKITGATGGVDPSTGARPFRQEINTFATSGAPYDLFILALRQLQSTDQTQPLSFFQIAGIHGYPQTAYDGVQGNPDWPIGYCMHFCPAFSTWHRPYMALYEQAIWTNAQAIALTYPAALQDEYIIAAISLRVPYWDWASHPYLPKAATLPVVTIMTPDGQATVPNPLHAYLFLEAPDISGIPSGTSGLPSQQETVRHWDPASGQSNQTDASETLLANANTISSYVYNMFSISNEYSAFSYAANGPYDQSNYNIEYIHGDIHVWIGGDGTMTNLHVASFDPIFFLHHANVDRLVAIWQALNPTSFIEPTLVNGSGTYYEPSGSWETGESSLAPFHSNDATTLWTSDGVRNISTFNYAYPELIDWNVSSAQLTSNVRLAVNKLYNPGALTTTGNSSTTTHLFPRRLSRSARASAFHNITFANAKSLHFNNLPMSWTISIVVQRYAHPVPFLVDFFMGTPEPDPGLRATASNLIGSHTTLFSGNATEMFPGGVPDVLMQGYVSLSHTLAAGVERRVLGDLTPGSVVPVLSEMLSWNARGVDGRDVDVGALAGLRVRVGSRVVRPARHGREFPKYEGVKWWDGVVGGKVGGT